jgi:hypothetical protein
MAAPRLTFFCELHSRPLQELLSEKVIQDLTAIQACISLGILDFSPERAEVVRRLNAAGIPTTAWLSPYRDPVSWLDQDKVAKGSDFYSQFRNWTEEEGLNWDAVGLDLEPDLREFQAIAENRWQMMALVMRRMTDRRTYRNNRVIFRELVRAIHQDGYRAESYQVPLVADERRAGSTLLQRSLGIVDLTVDREVWTLYTGGFSGVNSNGQFAPGVIWSYGSEAQAIAVGAAAEMGPWQTGQQPLSWDMLARDLRLAWYWTDNLYINSLEECVRQGFLERLHNFQWDAPIIIPNEGELMVESWRNALRTGLWMSSHLGVLAAGLAAGLFVFFLLRKILRRR